MSDKIITSTLKLGNSKETTSTTALDTSTQSDDSIISTKYYVDNGLSNKLNINDAIGKSYPNSINGEIFNNYSSNHASGICSHAEGFQTTAPGNYSHSEGQSTTAYGSASHAEGFNTIAYGFAHAEGESTKALSAGGT